MTPGSRLLEALTWSAGLLLDYAPTWGAVEVSYLVREYDAGRTSLDAELLRIALAGRR